MYLNIRQQFPSKKPHKETPRERPFQTQKIVKAGTPSLKIALRQADARITH